MVERPILQLASNGFPALSCIDRLTEVAAAAVREAAAQLRGRPSVPAPLHVPHVRQHFNWDCGLACVLMILRAMGVRGVDFASLRRSCPTTSVWTVDLAHLLRHYGMGVVFLTTMVGANPDYANEVFYAENMAADEQRVQILFQEAPAAGIPVHQRSLGSAEVKACMMSNLYLMLMLVDKSKLCSWSSAWGNSAYSDKHSYTGHYIVVCSYSSATDRYTIRDPAANFEHVQVAAASLDAARTSFGTDEDLLLVSTRPSSKRGALKFNL